MVILTWSDQLGVKLWRWTVLSNNPNSICRFRLIGFLPNQIIERSRIKEHGARMVPVGGKEAWVFVGEREKFWL